MKLYWHYYSCILYFFVIKLLVKSHIIRPRHSQQNLGSIPFNSSLRKGRMFLEVRGWNVCVEQKLAPYYQGYSLQWLRLVGIFACETTCSKHSWNSCSFELVVVDWQICYGLTCSLSELGIFILLKKSSKIFLYLHQYFLIFIFRCTHSICHFFCPSVCPNICPPVACFISGTIHHLIINCGIHV